MFTTPGFTDERIHVFLAAGLERGNTAHEADEFMTVETMTLSRALELIQEGRINDAKTALAILYAAGISRRSLSNSRREHWAVASVSKEGQRKPPRGSGFVTNCGHGETAVRRQLDSQVIDQQQS